MTWKDEYREQKEQSGKTWDEFAETELYHESELDDLRSCVDQLQDDVEALSQHVQQLRRNIGEFMILMEDDEK